MYYKLAGSRLKGTQNAECLRLETDIDVVSEEAPERIRDYVRNAERTCFTMQALVRSVPVDTAVTLNGQALSVSH